MSTTPLLQILIQASEGLETNPDYVTEAKKDD